MKPTLENRNVEQDSRKTRRSLDAFTLVEMLVVIAIIMTLAGMILSAASSATNMARKNKARVETQQIRTAILRYYADYSRYPFSCGNGTNDTDFTSADMVRVLQGEELTAANEVCNTNGYGSANPRKITYMTVNARDLKGIGGKSFYVDSWGNPYNVGFDTTASNNINAMDRFFLGASVIGTNGTNWLATSPSGASLTVATLVAVWSNGKDGSNGNGSGSTNATNSTWGIDDIGTWNQ